MNIEFCYYFRVSENDNETGEKYSIDMGNYNTYSLAKREAEQEVAEGLREIWESGISPNELFESYCRNGNEIVILPNLLPPGEAVFNSKEFVRSICDLACERFEKEDEEASLESDDHFNFFNN